MPRSRIILLFGLLALFAGVVAVRRSMRPAAPPPGPAPIVDPQPAAPPVVAAAPAPAVPMETGPWPASRDGLVFLWENAAAPNEVSDPSTGLSRVCRLLRTGWATWGPGHSADVTRGALVSEGNESAIAEACAASGAFSVELVLDPDRPAAMAGGTILCYAASDTVGNLLLYEWNGEAFLRFNSERTPSTKEADITLGPLPATGSVHLAVTCGAKGLAWYTNGVIQGSRPEPPGSLSGWTAQPLVLGTMPQGERNWQGRMEGLAFYRRALSAEEVAQHAASQAARVSRRPEVPRSDVRARLIQLTPAPSPDSLAPARAALVEAVYSAEEHLGGAPLSGMIIVQHWAVLDGVSVPASRQTGKLVRLQVEPLSAHPEVQGERVVSSVTEPGLERYIDIGWKRFSGGVAP